MQDNPHEGSFLHALLFHTACIFLHDVTRVPGGFFLKQKDEALFCG